MKSVAADNASGMEKAVMGHLKWATVLIMSAAVSDFTPRDKHKVKLDKDELNILNLQKTTDILAKAGKMKGRRIFMGFAAESGPRKERALEKLRRKKRDYIVFNDI